MWEELRVPASGEIVRNLYRVYVNSLAGIAVDTTQNLVRKRLNNIYSIHTDLCHSIAFCNVAQNLLRHHQSVESKLRVRIRQLQGTE